MPTFRVDARKSEEVREKGFKLGHKYSTWKLNILHGNQKKYSA